MRSYWLDLFTGVTWREFLEAGAEVSGFSEKRWTTLGKTKVGDYFLCYLTGVSRFIGVLEITSEPFRDETTVWRDSKFPSRVNVKPIVTLTPETAIPVRSLKNALSCFQNLKSPHAWTGRFRGSPMKWGVADGEAVVAAVLEAEKNPIVRPVDPKALSYRPKGMKSAIGSVTIPESDAVSEKPKPAKELTEHTEIQHRLYRLGRDLGLNIWIARNDKGREVSGKKFIDLPGVLPSLPALGLDQATMRTVELIDVLWIDKSNIVAAFEIESTTAVYSGLLRMADLLAMQPNTNIPLFIVAPDSRREKVFNEVNRPTFLKLAPPLSDVCRYVSFSSLRQKAKKHAEVIQMIKPAEFLDYLSETCELEEE